MTFLRLFFFLIVKRKCLPWSWLTNLAHTRGKICFEVMTFLSLMPKVGQILRFGNKWIFSSAIGICYTEFPIFFPIWFLQVKEPNTGVFLRDREGNVIRIIYRADNPQLPYSWQGRSSNREFTNFIRGAQGASTDLGHDTAPLPSAHVLLLPLPALLSSSWRVPAGLRGHNF